MKKTILVCMPNLGGGGAEKVLLTLLKNLNHAKYSITLLLTTNEGVYFKELPNEIETRFIFKQEYKFIIRLYYKLLKYIPSTILYKWFVKGCYDVEIAFLEGEAVKIIAGSKSAAKKIAWIHTDMSNYHWTSRIYRTLSEEKNSFAAFNKIVCVSTDAKEGFESLFAIDKTEVIYNVVDQSEIALKSKEKAVVFDNFTLCSVGKLIDIKGYSRLISVHKRLLEEGLLHDLYILGEGSQRLELEQQISQLNVGQSVFLLGFKRNPYPYIQACNLFVVSSKVEGFSMVVVEALVLGKAILGTDCSGVREVLDRGKYGIVVENSENGLYEGLRDVLCNQDKLKKYSELANERKTYFNLDNELKTIESLFDQF